MIVVIDGKACRFSSKIMDELDELIQGRDHAALADVLKAEVAGMPFEQLCYTESVYQQAKKIDARGMGTLSQIELAVQLVKFVAYYDPEEVYNNEGPKRIRNQKGRSG